MSKKSSVPVILGRGYAHLQHVMDKAIIWGFSRMKEAGKEIKEESAEAAGGVLPKAGRFGRKVLGFFGEAGDAYYREYERLKGREERSGKRTVERGK